MSLEGSWNRLITDIRNCLVQRFPNCPAATIEDIVTEILHQVVPYTSDVVKARDKVWDDYIKETLISKIKEYTNEIQKVQ